MFIGNRDFQKELTASDLSQREVYSLESYFSGMYPSQRNFVDTINNVISSSTQILYPKERHSLFKREVEASIELFQPNNNSEESEYEKFYGYVHDSDNISRSEIKASFKSVWNSHVGTFIALRQKTYYGNNSGCLSPYSMGNKCLDTSGYISEIIADIFSNPKNHFRLVVENLTFDDIRKVREDKDFCLVMVELEYRLLSGKVFDISSFKSFLRNEWSPVLFRTVRRVNKGAVINDNSKRIVSGTVLVSVSGVLGTISGEVLVGESMAVIGFSALASLVSVLYAMDENGYHNSLVKFKRGI